MTGSGIYTGLDGPKWAAPEGGRLRSESRPPRGVLEDREREVIGSVAPRKPPAKELDRSTVAQVAGSARQLFMKEQTSADQPEVQDGNNEYEDCAFREIRTTLQGLQHKRGLSLTTLKGLYQRIGRVYTILCRGYQDGKTSRTWLEQQRR